MRPLAWCAAALAAAFVVLPAQTPPADPDPLLRAMRDEIERSRKLTVADLGSPYFIQYIVDEGDTFTVSATLGGIVSRRRDHFRLPQAQVRVGSYEFDNTNFAGGGGGGSRYDLGAFPIDGSYPVLRRFLWLQTDMAYKASVELLARKKAAQNSVSQTDQINDFAKAEPVKHLDRLRPLAIDEEAWTNRVRNLSAIFANFPGLIYSVVDLDASTGGYYVVNSEGTEVRATEDVTFVRARAVAQSDDGTTIGDGITFFSLDAGRMPSEAEMARAITDFARNLVAVAHAPRASEDYTGPVVFEGQASPQLFAEMMGRNLPLTRRITGGRGAVTAASELEGRIGTRILPESFSIVDDPTQKEWRGRPLFGSYEVDREGVVPKPLQIVEKGVFRNFLLTRQPVRGFEGSNGRARLPGAAAGAAPAISNLFVSSSAAVPAADLKKKLIQAIQDRGKPYGIIVRKMDFPSFSGGQMGGGGQQGGARPISAPAMAYRVYADGHEELARGLRIRNFNVRTLRDIDAAGDDSQVFEFMNQSGGFQAETCVVAPSILVDEVELYKVDEEAPRLPVVPPPEISRK